MNKCTLLIDLGTQIRKRGCCMMCGSIHVLKALSELPPQEVEEAFLSIDESMPLSDESLEDFKKFFSYYERVVSGYFTLSDMRR